MQGQDYEIFEVRRRAYERHPDLVERVRDVREVVKQVREVVREAQRKLHGSEEYEKHSPKGTKWLIN